jgi:hypothetical protein
MTAEVLDMQALDVITSPWEDLKREVLADDPEAVAPVFVGDSEIAGIFLCDTCGSCGSWSACECDPSCVR